jgi:alanyl-tRNA synthetase
MNCSKLYYDEPYKKVLDATVEKVDGNNIYLDKTICYPEGGGQPGDRGYIDDDAIIDTQKDDSTIYHVVPNNKFKVGDSVTIILDWRHRYLYMKVHSAQHIISGILYNKFNIGTLSVHQGELKLTIEIDRSELSDDLCYQIEDEANKSINDKQDITYRVLNEDDAAKISLRRSIKAHGLIRFVDINSVDTIACGGLHVANTAEVGYVLYVGQEIVRSHVRLIFKVAEEAKKEIRTLQSIVDTLNVRHSSQSFEILDIDKKINEKLLQNERENKDLQLALSRTLFDAFVSECDDNIIMHDLSNTLIELSSFKDVIDKDDVALLLIKKVEVGALWFIYFGASYSNINIKLLKSELLSIINAKGGGRPPFYQGKGDYKEVEKLFESFRKLVNEKKS